VWVVPVMLWWVGESTRSKQRLYGGTPAAAA